MSFYIKVDHSKFDATASEIESYITKFKKNMSSADKEVTSLRSSWDGNDYNQFQSQWQKVSGTDSTSQQMLKSLENYAKFLRYSSSQYKEAQTKAVNKANSL